MKQLKLNREFLMRHLFVVVLLAGMGAWFGYDGFVRYPSMTPAELYADAHKGEAAKSEEEARKFYEKAIPRQHQFMWLCLLAAATVGAHLFAVSRLRFAFDESGFEVDGKRHSYDDIKGADRSMWDKKGILRIKLDGGRIVKLDSWHHTGVDEFAKLVK